MSENFLRTEFYKRAKELKINEGERKKLFNAFLECYNNSFKCAYCGEKMGLIFENEKSFTIDHILARVCGGSDDIRNLAFCCQSCNSMKKDKDAGWFADNVKRLKLRKNKHESWKARKASIKDKGLRDSYEQIFQHVKAKREEQ